MKLMKEISKLTTNKMVLHVVSFLALLTIIGYGMLNNLNAVALFIVIAILVFFINKNMVFVLGIPLVLVNLFVYLRGFKEGLENSTSPASQPTTQPTKQPTTTSSAPPSQPNNNPKRTTQGLPQTELQNASPPTDESFEVGRAKRSGGYNIDYASTVEDAYDELNKILGGDGIKKLTGDTQNLMKQQMQLAESMKSMEPLIKGMAPLMQQAQGLLGGLKDTEGLGGIMEMAKKFSGGQA